MQTGTLKELNVKPGDVVQAVKTWSGIPIKDGGVWTIHKDTSRGVKPEYSEGHEGIVLSGVTVWRIISRATPPIKLEAGKYYKTRDGRKVGPMRRDPDLYVIWDCMEMYPEDDDYHWFGDGRRGHASCDDCIDLIAEWPSDDTPAQPEPALWRDMTPEQKGVLLLAAHEGKVIECWHHSDTPEYWAEVDPSWADNCAYRIRPDPKLDTVTGYFWRSYGLSLFSGYHVSCATHRITFDTIDGKPDPASIRMDGI